MFLLPNWLLILITLVFYSGGHISIVQQLVKAGADINVQANGGMSSLMLSALHGHRTVVDALLQAKADVNTKSENGATAFVFAAEHKHPEIMAMLLEHGADNLLEVAEEELDLLFGIPQATIAATCMGITVALIIVSCLQLRKARYSSLERGDAHAQLIELYRKHNPKKEKDIPALLDTFKGHERELIDKVKAKYEDGKKDSKSKKND